jgi:PmbA protein
MRRQRAAAETAYPGEQAAQEAVERAIAALLAAGADKAQAGLAGSTKTELDAEAGELRLLRTVMDARLSLAAIVDGRMGGVTVNGADPEAVERAAARAVEIARASPADPANDIAPSGEPRSFNRGAPAPDLELMHRRLDGFLARSRRRFPDTRFEQCLLSFTRSRDLFRNSNGARFDSLRGIYGLEVIFSTRKDGRTSSFNGAGAARRGLEEPLELWSNVEELMRQNAEQTDPVAVEGTFTGDVILTPDCLLDFIGRIDASCLAEAALIRGSSPFRCSLGTRVASALFTLRSAPGSPEITDGYFFTRDGFAAEDSVLIDKGVLTGFNLSLYGSRKTGMPKAPNGGGCWIVDPGEASRDAVVGSVRKGLLLGRFSGGAPGANGDFTGVAKNSYLVEDGRIKRPVAETMIAGNVVDLLSAITAVSRERVDFGWALLPWVAAGGVRISGA